MSMCVWHYTHVNKKQTWNFKCTCELYTCLCIYAVKFAHLRSSCLIFSSCHFVWSPSASGTKRDEVSESTETRVDTCDLLSHSKVVMSLIHRTQSDSGINTWVSGTVLTSVFSATLHRHQWTNHCYQSTRLYLHLMERMGRRKVNLRFSIFLEQSLHCSCGHTSMHTYSFSF